MTRRFIPISGLALLAELSLLGLLPQGLLLWSGLHLALLSLLGSAWMYGWLGQDNRLAALLVIGTAVTGPFGPAASLLACVTHRYCQRRAIPPRNGSKLLSRLRRPMRPLRHSNSR